MLWNLEDVRIELIEPDLIICDTCKRNRVG